MPHILQKIGFIRPKQLCPKMSFELNRLLKIWRLLLELNIVGEPVHHKPMWCLAEVP